MVNGFNPADYNAELQNSPLENQKHHCAVLDFTDNHRPLISCQSTWKSWARNVRQWLESKTHRPCPQPYSAKPDSGLIHNVFSPSPKPYSVLAHNHIQLKSTAILSSNSQPYSALAHRFSSNPQLYLVLIHNHI